GDAFVLIFFGFVAVCGTTFAVGGAVPSEAWVPAAAVGAMTANILVVNNLRDVAGDRRVGKRTLVVRFGRRAALAQYGGSLLLAYGTPSVLWFVFDYPIAVHFGLLTLPLAAIVFRSVINARSGEAYNAALAKTAAVLFAYALGLALAIGLST
ncbi:MAG: 1,4-dihydroxy-2-naphthoate octaprenyltransferase, partial [Flavobacteriales bacterium]